MSPDELREPAGRDRSVYRALQAECARLRRMVEAVRDVHRPYPVYELCGHTEGDAACVDPVQLDDGTWTCGPLVAVVCSACCIDVRGQQTDECAEDHDHGDGLPPCLTVAALSEAGAEDGDRPGRAHRLGAREGMPVSAREELLAAARRLRETAAAATPGPWEDCSDPDGGAWPRYVIGSPAPGSDRGEEVLRVHESIAGHQVVTRDDTAWIALAHPGLAGPLAAWLEGVANGGTATSAALAVARAINGSREVIRPC